MNERPLERARSAASGDGVVASRMVRVTARDTARAEEKSSHRAVALDRRTGVLRAARIEAAMRSEQRSQRVLVSTDEEKEQGSHRLFASSRLSSSATAS